MNTAIQNRNNSYTNLNLSRRLKETLLVIEEYGPLTPQQALIYFHDNRPINTVQSRFTDLFERGYIKPIMSYENPKTGQPNTVYKVTTLKDRMDFSIKAGQAWTNRIKELENDFYCGQLSNDTQEWIKKEIKKHKTKLKNLIHI